MTLLGTLKHCASPDLTFCDPSNIFACAQLVQTQHENEYPLALTGRYPSSIAQFSNLYVL